MSSEYVSWFGKATSDYSAECRFCFKELNAFNMGEPTLKSHMKIKNHVVKAPVKYLSSYKNIFNVQKENIEPVSVK